MLRSFVLLVCLALVPLAHAWDRGHVDRFAELPPGAANPEGITVDGHGDVYVTTFAVTGAPPGKMYVFDPRGHLKRELTLPGTSNLLLGTAFHPQTHELLVVDFGNKTVVRVNPFSGATTPFTAIPGGAAAGPNALAFDAVGNVYISDSFQGTIWRTGPAGGAAVNWVTHPLLATTGVPPFGANGMDFNRAETSLFVANTGDDRIVRVPVAGGVAGTPVPFTNSVNGADGLFVDEHDNLWICANQADEIVVVNPDGKAIAKLGDFDGLRRGAPVGLLFPASLVRHGDWIYITNLSLDLRLFGHTTVDSEWAAGVSVHTIARIRARIP
jgi:sugar lactone lactonase YvrE